MEMKAPPQGTPVSVPLHPAVAEREILDRHEYISLYSQVGNPLQWDQRLRMPQVDLEILLTNPTTHLYVLRVHDKPVGLCEFEGVGTSDVELTNFGLIEAVQGQKLGPFLLDFGLRRVWLSSTKRVWLHTDTNDHPNAVPVYQRAGFYVYIQRMETFPD